MKYYVIKVTPKGTFYKKAKCLDTWNKTPDGCWKYSRQGAKGIVCRYNERLSDYERSQSVHYDFVPVDLS